MDAVDPRSALAEVPRPRHLRDLFADDPTRATRYVVEVADLRIDWSKQRVDDTVMTALVELAERSGVVERRDAMFAGEHVNVTEDRAVLHTALRAPRDASIVVDGDEEFVVVFDGVEPTTAARLADAFGADVFWQLDHEQLALVDSSEPAVLARTLRVR